MKFTFDWKLMGRKANTIFPLIVTFCKLLRQANMCNASFVKFKVIFLEDLNIVRHFYFSENPARTSNWRIIEFFKLTKFWYERSWHDFLGRNGWQMESYPWSDRTSTGTEYAPIIGKIWSPVSQSETVKSILRIVKCISARDFSS